jgi:hypothetical protein
MKGVCYNAFFGDPVYGKLKCIRISAPGRNTTHVLENGNFELNLEDSGPPLHINIVYFINIYVQPKYLYMFQSQMEEIRDTGLVDACDNFSIVVSGPAELHQTITIQGKQLIPKAEVFCSEGNLYEYPGIKKVWDMAHTAPADGVTLYFHSKGITHVKNPSKNSCRTRDERNIFSKVIGNWRNVLPLFGMFPSINKIGMACPEQGCVWFNYWWARNSYLSKCEDPIITTRRHYYEDWSHRYGADSQPVNNVERGGVYIKIKDDTYSIAYDLNKSLYNIGTNYSPEEAVYQSLHF